MLETTNKKKQAINFIGEFIDFVIKTKNPYFFEKGE
jgi:hypothetical protein